MVGLGHFGSKNAGLLVTCEQRDKDRLKLGLFTKVNFCMLVVPD